MVRERAGVRVRVRIITLGRSAHQRDFMPATRKPVSSIRKTMSTPSKAAL